MISLPILLLPFGEPVEVTGTGGTTPGGDENVLGSEAFLGMLQQLLLGSAVQMQPGAVPAASEPPFSATGPPVTETGTGSSEGALRQMPETLQLSGLVSSGAEDGADPASTRPHSGSTKAPEEQSARIPAALVRSDRAVPASGGVPAAATEESPSEPATPAQGMPMSSRDVKVPLPPILHAVPATDEADIAERPAQQPVPAPKGDERSAPVDPRVSRSGIVPESPRPGQRRIAVLEAAAKSFFDASHIPVSRKEGDVSSGRMQTTAPESHEAPKSPISTATLERAFGPLQTVVETDQHVTGREGVPAARQPLAPVSGENTSEGNAGVDVREGMHDGVKPLPAAHGQSLSGEGREQSGQRTPFFPAEAVGTLVKGEQTTPRDGMRGSEFLRMLSPESSQQVVDQVMKGFSLQVQGESSEIRVKLEPESLGEVVLHVRMEQGKMQAQIDVTQAAVKAVLETNLGQLRQTLLSRGIDVQRLDVSVGGEGHTHEPGSGSGERQSRQRARRDFSPEAVEQYQTGRMMGYNTLEIVM